jgi:hypothetical protein
MNDLLAQQQALLVPSQQAQWGDLAFILAGFAVACFLLWLFYASLRAIADEAEKLADQAEAEPVGLSAADALRAISGDVKYMPK